jgi:hypothetical protein
MRTGAVLAAGLATIMAGLALVLLDSETRQAGSNYVPELTESVVVGGGDMHCQDDQLIPADAASLRLLVGRPGEPTPGLEVSVRSEGRTIAAADVSPRSSQGHELIPIGPFEERREGAQVCIAVRGEGRGGEAVLHGTLGQVRLEWLRDGRENWLEMLPTVAHRFGLGKPFLPGPLVIWVAAGLLVLAWVVALRLTATELRR